MFPTQHLCLKLAAISSHKACLDTSTNLSGPSQSQSEGQGLLFLFFLFLCVHLMTNQLSWFILRKIWNTGSKTRTVVFHVWEVFWWGLKYSSDLRLLRELWHNSTPFHISVAADVKYSTTAHHEGISVLRHKNLGAQSPPFLCHSGLSSVKNKQHKLVEIHLKHSFFFPQWIESELECGWSWI